MRLRALFDHLDAPPFGWLVVGALLAALLLGALGFRAIAHAERDRALYAAEIEAINARLDSLTGKPCQWIPSAVGGRCVWPLSPRDTIRRKR